MQLPTRLPDRIRVNNENDTIIPTAAATLAELDKALKLDIVSHHREQLLLLRMVSLAHARSVNEPLGDVLRRLFREEQTLGRLSPLQRSIVAELRTPNPDGSSGALSFTPLESDDENRSVTRVIPPEDAPTYRHALENLNELRLVDMLPYDPPRSADLWVYLAPGMETYSEWFSFVTGALTGLAERIGDELDSPGDRLARKAKRLY